MPSPFRGTNWILDPSTGSFQHVQNGELTGTYRSYSDITAGAYSIDAPRPDDLNLQVRNSLGQFYAQVPRGDTVSRLQINQNGDYALNIFVGLDQVNEAALAHSRYSGYVPIKTTLPTGQEINDGVFGWMVREGDRLMIREGSVPGDLNRYAYVSDFYGDKALGLIEPGVGWRWATPAEAIDRGLVGAAIHQHFDEIQDLIAKGIYKPNGERIENTSDAAAYFVSLGGEVQVAQVMSFE